MRVPTVVTNDVLFHEPGRRILQDVVTCIRDGGTIDELGDRRERHADRHLKSPEEMERLFARYPEAIARTRRDRRALPLLARRTGVPISRGARRPLAHAAADPGEADLGRRGEALSRGRSRRRDRDPAPRTRADREAGLRALFPDGACIVRFARSKDILCQGRGSAANSAVCYVLGITSIDPARNDLLFERFVSEERHEPPDIDVDFEHERREEVIQWIYDLRPRSRRAVLDRDPLSHQGRDARRRQGARPDRGPDQDAVLAGLGLVGGRRRGQARRGAEPQPRRPAPAPDARSRPPADRRAAPSQPASRRLRADPRPARRPGADRAGRDGRPPGDRMGQGRHRRAELHEGRCARAWAC